MDSDGVSRYRRRYRISKAFVDAARCACTLNCAYFGKSEAMQLYGAVLENENTHPPHQW